MISAASFADSKGAHLGYKVLTLHYTYRGHIAPGTHLTPTRIRL